MKHIRKYNNINESKDESSLIQSIEDTFSDIKESYGLKIYKDYLNINRYTKVLSLIIVQINFKIENVSDGYINAFDMKIFDTELNISNERIEFFKKLKSCTKNIDENLFSFNNMKIFKESSNEIYEIYFNVN